MDGVVVLDRVFKTYKGFFGRTKATALDDVSLEVRRGEVFGLLGPNGSGKTTSLKLMLGLAFPSAGRIWLFEKEPTNVAVKQRIGFLPEESYHYRFLTAEESLRFYARFFRIADVGSRVDELLKLVGLLDVKDRPVNEFSKGMSRRLGLAQALINDPDLLLLDEPTSGLDPMGCHEVKSLINDLRREGKTIVLCSHLLADVEDVCDRIAILHAGKLQVQGTMTDLLVMQDRLQIICTGVHADRHEAIAAGIQAQGGNVVDFRQERSRLEDLFVRTIKDGQSQPDTEE